MSNYKREKFFIISGGPGSGKTTLVDFLSKQDYRTVPENGRSIIRLQSEINGPVLPWHDPRLFSDVDLSLSLDKFASQEPNYVTFFDRSIADVAGLLCWYGLSTPQYLKLAIEKFRYNPVVFIAPPWEQIYLKDTERPFSFADAEKSFSALMGIFEQYGYQTQLLPCVPVEDRAKFVLDAIKAMKADT